MPQQTIAIAQGFDDRHVGYSHVGTYPPTATLFIAANEDTLKGPRRSLGAASTYYLSNALLRFETGTIPNSATITAASLVFYVVTANNANTLALSADYFVWSGYETDYEPTPQTGAITSAALSGIVAGQDNTVALTNVATSINKSGPTSLRLHITQRAADAAPTGENRLEIAAEENGSLSPPRLVVTYTSETEAIPPDGIIATTNLTADAGGAPVLSEIQDDPDSPNALWWRGP